MLQKMAILIGLKTQAQYHRNQGCMAQQQHRPDTIKLQVIIIVNTMKTINADLCFSSSDLRNNFSCAVEQRRRLISRN
jgi:hypothetical protein